MLQARESISWPPAIGPRAGTQQLPEEETGGGDQREGQPWGSLSCMLTGYPGFSFLL